MDTNLLYYGDNLEVFKGVGLYKGSYSARWERGWQFPNIRLTDIGGSTGDM